ncbi:hypothetical protein J4H39_22650 [Vibrio alginolyticus]|uniref:Uncharacterized protein n=1 Tax=Vibrio alginolyticus TaxID=663 RepID=A0A7Y0MUR3_VIBAL|nr:MULTISPECIES: hypothetical protein [Vibrio]MBT0000051.1 hypothetical protein [Vibrio alginolyticus]MDW2201769.1 hypothetical protein [Vibrio sp. 1636]NMR73723.1 hypothetical protein [Vibrio alginolyticus]
MLKIIKYILVTVLISSFFWLYRIVENQNYSHMLVFILGALSVYIGGLPTGGGSFSLKGIGKRTPGWTAMIMLPMLMIILLAITPGLIGAFNDWSGLIRSPGYSAVLSMEFLTWTLCLGVGGVFIFIITVTTQVYLKKIVDYLCDG